MIDVRNFDSLGGAEHGWLTAKHHFSFAGYYDPARMGWGKLRVWNDDLIRAKTGFPPHPHRDMEIITYVREGAITHRDHLNNEGRTVAGDVQVMSAGRGIQHEEWNLEDEDTRIFQIWIEPNRHGVTPRWETAAFPKDGRKGKLVPLASGKTDAPAEALWIAQDAEVLGATLDAGAQVTHLIGKGRLAYLVPAKGRIEVNGVEVDERSGAAIRDIETLTIRALDDAEIVLVDLPPEE
ncbi:pirin family protein [Parvibaculum sp.]|jgi:quercetin 2,3-dioxygenase|uniref:pirin family protein n=1 Tax=Parvibaculum sp. TaxID=2024848 RepID=UPI001B1AF46A|nr:pirin family protein [Parvibaculum sp.]MBO6635283.1 pirin family protein [Parvibaculum sp.]MBO6679602.1 pirin family protein [Parvibaculum sp.]MBO6684889.1 pirin family protein [Parvibaculum sp.]MBO6905519.1 pirin family protein [Parvibaculum sp.]